MDSSNLLTTLDVCICACMYVSKYTCMLLMRLIKSAQELAYRDLLT